MLVIFSSNFQKKKRSLQIWRSNRWISYMLCWNLCNLQTLLYVANFHVRFLGWNCTPYTRTKNVRKGDRNICCVGGYTSVVSHMTTRLLGACFIWFIHCIVKWIIYFIFFIFKKVLLPYNLDHFCFKIFIKLFFEKSQ